MLQRFFTDRRGNIALIAALMTPVLLGVGGIGVDYARLYQLKTRLQDSADASALAAIREATLSNFETGNINEAAVQYAESAFFQSGDGDAASGLLKVEAKLDKTTSSLKVDLAYEWAPMFAQLFDAQVTPTRASATARIAGAGLTCVLGLMPAQAGLLTPKASVHLENKANLQAEGCGVFSNSTDKYALRVDTGSIMAAQTICSAGGVMKATNASISPAPITDCPKVQDPLLNRPAPFVGACEFNNLVVSSSAKLKPGVYCGGLQIRNGAKATLGEGIYVIKDGPLFVSEKASLVAPAAGFFLTGKGSLIDFQPDSTIDLSAMQSGDLAGLLFFEDRNTPYTFNFNVMSLSLSLTPGIPFAKALPADLRIHRITSNNARNLLGTLYLPNSIMMIDANAKVAQDSAYTAIVTGRLWLREGPILYLNANYTDTKVPVPQGLLGDKPVLVN